MVFTRLHSMLNSYLCLKGRGGRYNNKYISKRGNVDESQLQKNCSLNVV